MKPVVWGLLLLFAFSCSDKVEEVPLSNLADHNMKILHENLGGADLIKLVIYDDCTYNVLSEVRKANQAITITKKFNSMMKWPCVMQNDTIVVGVFPEGTYKVNYRLLDTSTEITDPVSLSIYFMLTVAKQ